MNAMPAIPVCKMCNRYANGVGCCDPGSATCNSSTTPLQCSSAYHSCTVPIKITGSTPRASYVCPPQPTDWPVTWEGTSASGAAQPVDVTVGGIYRQESSSDWTNGQLLSVPPWYNEAAGFCTDYAVVCACARACVHAGGRACLCWRAGGRVPTCTLLLCGCCCAAACMLLDHPARRRFSCTASAENVRAGDGAVVLAWED
jgi:hypothetical protein